MERMVGMTGKKTENSSALELKLGGGATILKRKDIPETYIWKLSDIYADEAEWERGFKTLKERMGEIVKFSGTLGQSEAKLLECLKLRDEFSITLGMLYVYANMKSHEDTADSKYQGLSNKIASLSVEFSTLASFITPEILTIPEKILKAYINAPALSEYAFSLKELLRQRKRVSQH